MGDAMWYLLGWIPLGLPVVLLLGWVVTRGRSRSGPNVGRSRHNVDAHSLAGGPRLQRGCAADAQSLLRQAPPPRGLVLTRRLARIGLR